MTGTYLKIGPIAAGASLQRSRQKPRFLPAGKVPGLRRNFLRPNEKAQPAKTTLFAGGESTRAPPQLFAAK